MKTTWVVLITLVLTVGIAIGIVTLTSAPYYYLNYKYGEAIEEASNQRCQQKLKLKEKELVGIAGWKTYANREFRFRIDYPSKWYLTTSTGEGLAVITNFKYPQATGRELSPSETKRVISVVENPNDLTPRQLLASGDEGSKILEESPLIIDDIQATKFKTSGPFGTSYHLYIPGGADNEMILIVSAGSTDKLDEMLESIKLTLYN